MASWFLLEEYLVRSLSSQSVCSVFETLTTGVVATTERNERCTETKSIFLSQNVKGSWMQSFLYCNRVDMKIPSLRDQNEFSQFERLCVNAASVRDPFAIGAIRGSSSFTWVDSFGPTNYPLQWLPGEPNHSEGLEFCAVAHKINGKLGLNDAKCDGGSFQIICETEYARGSCVITWRNGWNATHSNFFIMNNLRSEREHFAVINKNMKC